MFQDETGLDFRSGRPKRLILWVLTLVAASLFTPQIRAQTESAAALTLPAQRYFSIREEQFESTASSQAVFSTPTEALGVAWTNAPRVVAKLFSLLDWVQHRGGIEVPSERYDRRQQFGTWRTNPDDNSCLDSRGLVLERDSLVRVATRQSSDRCVVVAGRWVDPYSGETETIPKNVDIDHLVPLKNAYDSGAWRWNKVQRCQYFNFTSSPIHLRALTQSQNSIKGDSSPAKYIPPLRSAQCEYLKNWLSVKLTWGLDMPADEAAAIHEHVKQAGCNEAEFKLKRAEFEEQRKAILANNALCGTYQFIPIAKQ